MSDTEVDFKSLVQDGRGVQHKSAGLETKQFPALLDIKSVDEKSRRIEGIASTGNIDRDGEIILPSAFAESLPIYMKNNIVLAAHAHRLDTGQSPVVANVIKAVITKNGLEVIIEFHDITELAEQYWQLYSQKKQRGLSVGFIPQEGGYEEHDGRRVYVHTKIEWLELSVVPVGSNREALSRSKQRKADFVAAKKEQTAEEKQYQYDLQELREQEPDFDEKCQEFADILLGFKGSGEVPEGITDYAGIVTNNEQGEFAKIIKGH